MDLCQDRLDAVHKARHVEKKYDFCAQKLDAFTLIQNVVNGYINFFKYNLYFGHFLKQKKKCRLCERSEATQTDFQLKSRSGLLLECSKRLDFVQINEKVQSPV